MLTGWGNDYRMLVVSYLIVMKEQLSDVDQLLSYASELN